MAGAWPGRKAPLDGAPIATARAGDPDAEPGRPRLCDPAAEGAGVGRRSPGAAGAVLASGDAQAFANGDARAGHDRALFLHPRRAIEKAYQSAWSTVQNDLKKDLWVMGEDAETAGLQSQMGNIRPGVAALYATDYIAAWERVVAALQPAAYFSDPAAYGAFTKTPSPLKMMLLELRKNTTFTGGAGAANDGGDRRMQSTHGPGVRPAALRAGGGNVDAGAEIAGYFKPLHDYVGDGKAPAPIDEFVAAMKQAGLGAHFGAAWPAAAWASDAVQAADDHGDGRGRHRRRPARRRSCRPSSSPARQGGGKAQVGAAPGRDGRCLCAVGAARLPGGDQGQLSLFRHALRPMPIGRRRAARLRHGRQRSTRFYQQRMLPLLDTRRAGLALADGQISVAAALDPASPDEFARPRNCAICWWAAWPCKIEATVVRRRRRPPRNSRPAAPPTASTRRPPAPAR